MVFQRAFPASSVRLEKSEAVTRGELNDSPRRTTRMVATSGSNEASFMTLPGAPPAAAATATFEATAAAIAAAPVVGARPRLIDD